MLTLDSPLDALPGIGPRRAERLAGAGLATIEDLLFHLPFRYEDRTRCRPVGGLQAGEKVTVRARVLAARLIRTRKRGFTIVDARLGDDSGEIRAVWYNQPYLARVLVPGREGFFYGEIRSREKPAGGAALENPEIELIAAPERSEETADPPGAGELPAGRPVEAPLHTGRVVPIYRSVGGLSSRVLRRLIHGAIEALADGIEDFLPAELRRKRSLTWRAAAFRGVHFPPPDTDPAGLADGTTPWHHRLIYEEFFMLQLGLAIRRREMLAEERGFSYRFSMETRRKLAGLLPFKLTRAQERVLREIRGDLERSAPMNRLLQGDVGSGKTVVAALTLAIAVENGLQAAIVAPTEILAAQHASRLAGILGPGGYTVHLLTGSVRGAERRRILEAAAGGEPAVFVGTHALMSAGVGFGRLGLVVMDEQHRFGVSQRQALRSKGRRPDALVMTATPIPRTLAMTVYGDLDHSLLDEMPPGRHAVKTLLRSEENRDQVYEGIRGELSRGRQGFIIYPLVEETEDSDLGAAVEMAGRLAGGPFAGYRVACLHGRVSPDERDRTMQAFARGEIDLLVATTVVEVGIDIPNATMLVIEHPERFGLSQLHQLRGRVGRGGEKAWCILIGGEDMTPEASRRLEAFVEEPDGFRLAARDLELRGPGDLAGTRQHGVPALRAGNLVRDAALMELARRDAAGWVERIASARTGNAGGILKRLDRRWGRALDLAVVG